MVNFFVKIVEKLKLLLLAPIFVYSFVSLF